MNKCLLASSLSIIKVHNRNETYFVTGTHWTHTSQSHVIMGKCIIVTEMKEITQKYNS